MTISPYTRGRSFEYERVHYHRSSGAFLAVRSAGSRGPWDILALYPNRIVLEQCKRVPELTPDMEFRKEREYLAGVRVPAGVEANLVVRGERGVTRLFRIHPTATPAPSLRAASVSGPNTSAGSEPKPVPSDPAETPRSSVSAP